MYEAKHKALLPGMNSDNERFFKTAVAEKLGMLRSIGVPIYRSTEANQEGLTFGEKLCKALENVFSLGYKNVIITGNDCPHLNSVILQKAVIEINNARCVVGPDKRGGLYLFGISKEFFLKGNLQNLPWQTTDLCAAVIERCAYNLISPFVLCSLHDVNTSNDFYSIKTFHKGVSTLLQFIKNLFYRTTYSLFLPQLSADPQLVTNASLRAPPVR